MRPKHANRTAIALASVLAVLLSGCGGGHGTNPDDAKTKASLLECTSYVRELRACAERVGAPAPAADALTSTLARSDDAARAQLEGACARDRAHLHDTCK